MKRKGYQKTIDLFHHEKAAKLDMHTGEIVVVQDRRNNIPKGKSKLDYNDFTIVNNEAMRILETILSHEAHSVLHYIVNRVEMNTNSLDPLNDKTKQNELAKEFKLEVRRVKKIFDELYTAGVYLQLRYFSYTQKREVNYWVLNPIICWKGSLVDKHIMACFYDTLITKLVLKQVEI
jgi:hypothetical protein